jgi:hypothetical protein
MQDLKSIAIDVLAANPSLKEVFAAQDGNMFATELAADMHNKSKEVNTATVKPEHFERAKLAKEIETFLNPAPAKAEKSEAAPVDVVVKVDATDAIEAIKAAAPEAPAAPAAPKAPTKAKAEETK